MIIVAGHITVAPEEREDYLASCVNIVEQARNASGCLDMSISADLVDPARINIFERWESQAELDAFRTGGPAPEQRAAMLSVSVEEYDVAEARSLFGEAPAEEPAG
ncbi:antibiotic biosynthesis monooxygenase [Brevibacterium daeguense]|uniref:Antibiotic biosynthesis monooxygenase n=1 Tax=Brevibacterium daeguense TaxID=909936 RepID=A0ABP8EIS8_9MICO|nr:antibiotic biosynthesis monooxygenase family protein [Brevibacterium daeguense]